MNFDKLGGRIRVERITHQLTQERLAEKANISVSYLGQIERGERKPSLETTVAIANCLGVTVDYLLSDSYLGEPKTLVDELNFLVRERPESDLKTIIEVTKTLLKNRDNP